MHDQDPAAPPEEPDEGPRHLRISLRTTLIGLGVLGAVTGLMGRLYLYDVDVFLGVLGGASVVVPFLTASVAMIVAGARSQRTARRQGWLLPLGVVTLLAPLVGMMAVAFGTTYRYSMPSRYVTTSTGYLIHTELPKDFDYNFEVWEELRARAADDRLLPAEATLVAEKFLAHMQSQASGWDQSLWTQQGFLVTALAKGLIAEDLAIEICGAYYGDQPRIEMLAPPQPGDPKATFVISHGPGTFLYGGPYTLANRVRAVRVNGEEAAFSSELTTTLDDYGEPVPQQVYHCDLPADSAAITITADLDLAYIASTYDPQQWEIVKLGDFRGGSNASVVRHWTATASWTSATAPKNLALNTDPASDPDIPASLHITGLCTWQVDGGLELELGGFWAPWPSSGMVTGNLAASFSVSAEIGDQTCELSPGLWKVWDEDDYQAEPFRLTAKLDALPADADRVTLVLKPNPVHVQHVSGLTEIWGKPERIIDLPLARLDLAAVIEEQKADDPGDTDE